MASVRDYLYFELLHLSWFVVKPHDYCNRNLVNYILGGG